MSDMLPPWLVWTSGANPSEQEPHGATDTRPIRGSGPLFDEVTSGLLRTLTLCGWGS
jgi:hypothetical protein